jgi:hypothetical protein
MTREEFQGHVTMVFSSALDWRGEPAIYWRHGTEDYYEVSWISGGRCGGNCWGDSADTAVTPEPEADLPLLDELLDAVAPALTVRQYKQLLANVVHHDDRSDYEYYGNYTTYSIKRVRFDTLYEHLKDMEVI